MLNFLNMKGTAPDFSSGAVFTHEKLHTLVRIRFRRIQPEGILSLSDPAGR